MTKFLDRVIAVGLMVAIAFTALALGTVEAWSIAIFELIITLLIVLWAAKAIVEKHIEIKIPPAALPLAALVLLGLIQSFAFTGSEGRIRSLSMDVEATRAAVVVIFFLFVCYLITANFYARPKRMRILANFLIIFGLALGIFALIQHFTWDGRLFWFRPAPNALNGMGGPFVNRNHFAGYMEMIIPIPLALSLSRALRGEARLFYGFAAVIMAIAEVASLSRGGVVSLTAGMLFVAAISIRMRRRTHRAPSQGKLSVVYPLVVAVLIAAAIVAGIFWVGADRGLVDRIAGTPSEAGPGSRSVVWAGTFAMFLANPVLGVGIGAFQTVYPIYEKGDGSLLIEFAHNDYLQALADGGIIAGALVIWFIIATFRSFARGLKQRDPIARALTLGAGAGIFAMLVHSLFDFNLQLPSNALLFLVLSAMIGNFELRIANVELKNEK